VHLEASSTDEAAGEGGEGRAESGPPLPADGETFEPVRQGEGLLDGVPEPAQALVARGAPAARTTSGRSPPRTRARGRPSPSSSGRHRPAGRVPGRRRRLLRRVGAAAAHRGRVRVRRGRGGGPALLVRRRADARGAVAMQHPAGPLPVRPHRRRRLVGDRPRPLVPGERLRPVRGERQRVGSVLRPVRRGLLRALTAPGPAGPEGGRPQGRARRAGEAVGRRARRSRLAKR
jgi:hypothetical protein